MSYRFMFKEPFYSLSEESAESWFVNSYDAVDDDEGTDLDIVDAKYQRVYNVKIITESKTITHENTNFEDKYDFVAGVEFESEADAVMFILRWS